MIKSFAYSLNLLSFSLLLFTIFYPSHKIINSISSRIYHEQDTIPPTANCLTGLITITMPFKGCVIIHPKDIDGGSFDNITSVDKLKFYFDGDQAKDSIVICCDDFVAAGANDELLVDLNLWVEDEAGNKAFCKAKVIVQDINNVCPSIDPFYNIQGSIHSYTGENIDAKIILTEPNGSHHEMNGSTFNFPIIGQKGTYKLCLENNSTPFNGITSADMVKIRKHILELAPFSSPYQLISADVNLSKSITAADITELRKLIFGITTKFSKVPSWIFIPSDYIFPPNVFPDAKQFIPSCKTFEIKNSIEINFIGVKMGDVN